MLGGGGGGGRSGGEAGGGEASLLHIHVFIAFKTNKQTKHDLRISKEKDHLKLVQPHFG